jgi:hypothetical protein
MVLRCPSLGDSDARADCMECGHSRAHGGDFATPHHLTDAVTVEFWLSTLKIPMPRRRRIPAATETSVLLNSARRCTLCHHLTGDLREKHGQIAHLDGDPANHAEDNLAFMCLEHHSLYESKTSQHKNYSIAEIKRARARLYRAVRNGNHLVTDKLPSGLNCKHLRIGTATPEHRKLPLINVSTEVFSDAHAMLRKRRASYLAPNGEIASSIAELHRPT